MKKVILLALIMPLQASGQIFENFESGNLVNWVQSQDEHWIADTTSGISGVFSLHHIFDNPDAGTDQTGIPVKNLHPAEGATKWSFMVRHGYDPSSSNNWAIFLMSDSEPESMVPGAGIKGFAVGVNISGYDDTLRLWKVNGSSISILLTSRINWQNDIGTGNALQIVAERSGQGEWKMSAYNLNDQLIDSSFGSDDTLFASEWFGVYYKYSSTRDKLLWLDNIKIEGSFYEDNEAPAVSEYKVIGMNSLEISFSEEPSAGTLLPVNFSLNGIENKSVSVLKESMLTYIISFSNRLINKSLNSLNINKLCDKSGNCADNIYIPFTPAFAVTGDVIISEIMADPLPVVSLPAKEYIEITNRSGFTFNLKNWRLSSENRSELFPALLLPSDGRLIICPANDTLSFSEYGPVAGLKQFPSLNDARMILFLSDNYGNLIHGIEYSSEWYRDQLKTTGGWALEMIDTSFPFYNEENWSASTSRKGGTPGKENSVSHSNHDDNFKGILNVFPEDSVSINVRFSETVMAIDSCIDFIISQRRKIIEMSPADQLHRAFRIKSNEPLVPGNIYSLAVTDGITDFAGNRIETAGFSFGLPEISEIGDILFNELLFNPLPGDPDYIEFYNNSDKIIDASRIYIVTVSNETGDTSSVIQLSDEKRCILPGAYFSVTTDKEKVIKRYSSSDPDYIFQIASLPSMNDDSGHLILLNRELDKIDEVFYDDKMHYALLEEKEGVALEKTRQQNPSDERSGWHTASESSGWGTPGARNSVDIQNRQLAEGVILSSTKITPDNDGIEDLLAVGLNLQDNGNVVSVTIFDETGMPVRRLADNLLAAPETAIIWDASADDGELVRTGIYIIFIEMYNSSGKVKKWKKVCTVIRD